MPGHCAWMETVNKSRRCMPGIAWRRMHPSSARHHQRWHKALNVTNARASLHLDAEGGMAAGECCATCLWSLGSWGKRGFWEQGQASQSLENHLAQNIAECSIGRRPPDTARDTLVDPESQEELSEDRHTLTWYAFIFYSILYPHTQHCSKVRARHSEPSIGSFLQQRT